MSRLTYLLGVGIVLVALAFLLSDHVLYSSRRIRLCDAQRIRLGMTLAEVEALFGRRADQVGGINLDCHHTWMGIDNTAIVWVGFHDEVYEVLVVSSADWRKLLYLRPPREPVDDRPLTKLSDLLEPRPAADEGK